MKYRIKVKREIFKWEYLDTYEARECYYVQQRILYFFWITLKSFWSKDMAHSYYTALNELNKK